MTIFIRCPVGCYRCSGCEVCGARANECNIDCKNCMECAEATSKFVKIVSEAKHESEIDI